MPTVKYRFFTLDYESNAVGLLDAVKNAIDKLSLRGLTSTLIQGKYDKFKIYKTSPDGNWGYTSDCPEKDGKDIRVAQEILLPGSGNVFQSLQITDLDHNGLITGDEAFKAKDVLTFEVLHEMSHALDDLFSSTSKWSLSTSFQNALRSDISALESKINRGIALQSEIQVVDAYNALSRGQIPLTITVPDPADPTKTLTKVINVPVLANPSNEFFADLFAVELGGINFVPGHYSPPITVSEFHNAIPSAYQFFVNDFLNLLNTNLPADPAGNRDCKTPPQPGKRKQGGPLGALISAGNAPRFDPLVLDLNRDGVQTLGLADSEIFTEIRDTGFMARSGWVSEGDGFLSLDRNQNGAIDGPEEFFGNQTLLSNSAYANDGFEALSEFDDNQDGVIDSNDSVYSSLKVFRADGQEFTLSDLGVSSISLLAQASGIVDSSGNTTVLTSSFAWNDGTRSQISDIDLVQDPFDSYFSGYADFEPMDYIGANFAGMGIVKDLNFAREDDTSGALDDLYQQVLQASDFDVQYELFDQLFLKWAGADSQPHSIPYLHMDGQILYAIKQFAGGILKFDTQGGPIPEDLPGAYQGEVDRKSVV